MRGGSSHFSVIGSRHQDHGELAGGDWRSEVERENDFFSQLVFNARQLWDELIRGDSAQEYGRGSEEQVQMVRLADFMLWLEFEEILAG
jgi:hypothetical protein